MLRPILTTLIAGATGAMLAVGGAAAQTPKSGGVLKFAVVAEPPTTDCHATNTFAVVHPVIPQYSTLLKFTGPHDDQKIVGDLAESWEMSKDGMTFTFKLRDGVTFHDGSPFSSADVKASYERIIWPKEGVLSQRKAVHQDIGTIETPDPRTVIFRMKRVNASILLQFASPYNCIYSSKLLERDPRYPEKQVMGTGAFQFVEHVKGSHWKAKRFERYFLKGRPYLDGYIAYFVRTPAVVAGLIGGQFDAEFRGRSPQERDRLVATMKSNVRVFEGPWITNIQLALNNQREAIKDVRVRRAITLAIDRWGGSASLGKVSIMKGVSGLFRPGSPFALPVEELKSVPGFWTDIEKSRTEARRLLAEAGRTGLRLKLLNRQIGDPYPAAGIYTVDQLRRVGIELDHVQLESKLYYQAMYKGDYDITITNVSDFVDDPNAQLNTLLSLKKSGNVAYSRHSDYKVDEMYDRQATIIDPTARLKLVHELERYILDQAYSLPLLWFQRIVANHRRVMGWELPASHFLGQNLVEVWLND